MQPLVSIIIPFYNAERYLSATLQSAIDQTWNNKEIIVVDDGSTDRSIELITNFKSDKVKLYQQQNKGAAAARNLGLSHAKGEYVQFLDADDLLSKDKIEKQVLALQNHPDQVAVCSTVHFKDDEDPYYWVLLLLKKILLILQMIRLVLWLNCGEGMINTLR